MTRHERFLANEDSMSIHDTPDELREKLDAIDVPEKSMLDKMKSRKSSNTDPWEHPIVPNE